jgi:hypothetical protein
MRPIKPSTTKENGPLTGAILVNDACRDGGGDDDDRGRAQLVR